MFKLRIFKLLIFKILRLIAKIQESVSEKHTAYYILLESAVLGVTMSLIFLIINLNIISFILPISSFLILGSFGYIILLSRSQNNPAIIELNKYVILVLIFTSHIPIVFYYFIEYNILNSSLTSIAIFAYILNLQIRNKKYLKESEFFTNKYSKTYGSWINASIKLEKAIRNLENKNELLSYYWSLRAEWNYNRITYYETLEFKEIASELSAASNLISAASLADKGYRIYSSEIYKTLGKAFELTNNKICDKCGNQLQVGNIHNYNNNKNLCDACKRMKSVSVGSNNKQTSSYKRPFWRTSNFNGRSNENKKEEKQEYTYNREQYTDKNTQHRSQRTSRSRDKKEKKHNNNKNLDKYFEILDISKDASMSELKKSYRKKVKHTHPDAGGSPEQFKKIKEAYNKVKPEIENTNTRT